MLPYLNIFYSYLPSYNVCIFSYTAIIPVDTAGCHASIGHVQP